MRLDPRLSVDACSDGFFGVNYDARHIQRPLLEGWDYRRRKFVEEYCRGAVCIVVKFRRERIARVKNGGGAGGACVVGLTFHLPGDTTIRIEKPEGRNGGRPDDWRDNAVLVRVVEKLELVEPIAPATDKDLLSDEEVFHPLAGCFHSIARGFEVNPRIPCREFDVAILRALVDPDKPPCDVIQSGTKVVNSIASYQGDLGRQLLEKFNAGKNLSSFSVLLNGSTVRFVSDEGVELPFEVRDVMLGPLKL